MGPCPGVDHIDVRVGVVDAVLTGSVEGEQDLQVVEPPLLDGDDLGGVFPVILRYVEGF